MFYFGRGIGINALRLNVRCLAKSNSLKGIISKNTSIIEILAPKHNSLVDIRKEWLKKLYPEKDIYIKNNNIK